MQRNDKTSLLKIPPQRQQSDVHVEPKYSPSPQKKTSETVSNVNLIAIKNKTEIRLNNRKIQTIVAIWQLRFCYCTEGWRERAEIEEGTRVKRNNNKMSGMVKEKQKEQHNQ